LVFNLHDGLAYDPEPLGAEARQHGERSNCIEKSSRITSMIKHHEALRRAEQLLPRIGYGAGALRDPMLTYRREKSEVH
jgi:hypothetical protein